MSPQTHSRLQVNQVDDIPLGFDPMSRYSTGVLKSRGKQSPAGNMAFPRHRHLKSSSLQTPLEDMEFMSKGSAGSVISEWLAKYQLCAIFSDGFFAVCFASCILHS
jgi:hypothetical protein